MAENKDKAVGVCFVSLDAYPLFNAEARGPHGGSEIDAYMIGTELAKDERFKITFIVAESGQPSEEIINRIRLVRCDGLNKNLLAAAVSLYRAMKAADCDIYFRKTPTLPTFLTAFFCRLKRKLFFYRSASATNCNGSYLKQHWLRGRLFRWALKQASVVLVQNRTDVDLLKQTMGIDSVFVPNGHHIAGHDEKPRDSILWVGRSIRVKRPELFIELAKRLPQERFVMICERARGDKGYDKLVQQAELSGNVEFRKSVGFDKIDIYFQRAKMFVNTSDFEGFPNTFIQACSSGTPILSINVNPDKFLERYNCGLCADGDWDTFVKQVKILLDPVMRTECGQNARKYVRENHDIEKIIERYKKLFLEAAPL